MRGLKFALAVLATSIALVAVLGVAGLLVVRSAVASSPFAAAAWSAGPWSGGPGFKLPPELQGLSNLPADQRFGHFLGVQVYLRDQNDQPLTLNITPGTVSSASATSLSMAANDGSSKTFALDSNTAIHGVPSQANAQGAQPSLANGDKVVVVTINGSSTATAVMDGGANGFAGPPHGPWGWGH